jgi:hypothetical protein
MVRSGDYIKQDLRVFGSLQPDTQVDWCIEYTDCWTIPSSVRHDNLSHQWAVYPQFSVVNQHVIRWYALKLYDFIRDYGEADGWWSRRMAKPTDGEADGWRYQYLMRLDEDAYIHSPIMTLCNPTIMPIQSMYGKMALIMYNSVACR